MKLQTSATNVRFNLTDDNGNTIIKYEYDQLNVEVDASTAVKAGFDLIQLIGTQIVALKAKQREAEAQAKAKVNEPSTAFQDALAEAQASMSKAG